MSDVAANAQAGQMMTADGIPLKKSLKASLRGKSFAPLA